MTTFSIVCVLFCGGLTTDFCPFCVKVGTQGILPNWRLMTFVSGKLGGIVHCSFYKLLTHFVSMPTCPTLQGDLVPPS